MTIAGQNRAYVDLLASAGIRRFIEEQERANLSVDKITGCFLS